MGAELRQQRSRQLLRYLDETKGIEGPGRDLVHAQGVDSELPQKLADELEGVSRSGDKDQLDRLVKTIRKAAEQAAEVQGLSPAEAVRDAEREVLHLLSRRTRSRNDDESGPAIHVLLGAVPLCVGCLDPPTAARVLARIDLYLSNAGDLDEDEVNALDRLRAAGSATGTALPTEMAVVGNGHGDDRLAAEDD